MANRRASFTFASEDDTCRFAAALGAHLRPGDVILLEGNIGAGKTFLARALIRSLQTEPEDVPSPTFTLVQIYDSSAGEICHSDLYRIQTIGEIEELGLIDAFQTDICMIEWPDRLGSLIPTNALTVALRADDTDPDCRYATLSWKGDHWDARLRQLEKDIAQ